MQRHRSSEAQDAKAACARRKGTARTVLKAVLPAVAVVALARVLLVGLYRVPSSSMEPAIHTGSCILGERVSYRTHAPRRGDVVTFESPEESGITLVKRVIATEGQVVDFHNGSVYVDGQRLNEPYVREGTTLPPGQDKDTDAYITYPHTVARGCVWVMGDNRAASRDSRFFGDVPASSISSRVLLAYWPPEAIGPVR